VSLAVIDWLSTEQQDCISLHVQRLFFTAFGLNLKPTHRSVWWVRYLVDQTWKINTLPLINNEFKNASIKSYFCIGRFFIKYTRNDPLFDKLLVQC